MMRPVSVAVPPETPDRLAAPVVPGAGSLNLSWYDNSLDETAFVVQRDTGTGFQNLATLGINGSNPADPINTLNTVGIRSYTDTTYPIGEPAYSYRVKALNTVGYGGAYMQTTVQSISAPVLAGGLGPAAPINLTGILSAGGGGPSGLQVALSWTNNATAADGYVVQRSITGANTFTQIGTVFAPGAVQGDPGSFTDTTVAPGMSYDYRVAATMTGVLSAYSNVFTIAVPPAPGAPSALTATAQVGPQIALAWTANPANVTGFTIQRATDTAFTTGLTSFTVAANVTTYTDTPVVPGTTYSYRVRADNGIVASPWSNTATVTFPAVPATPTSLTATQLPGLQAALAWTDNATNENSYVVERSVNGGAFAALSTLPANSTSYNDAGLAPNTTYAYRVAAVNNLSGPSAYSNTATLVVPAVPSAPTPPVATQQAGLQILVAWTNTTSGGTATDVTLQRSVDGGATWTTLGVLAPTTSLYLDAPAIPGTAYLYRVNASNLSGVSAWATSGSLWVPSIPAAPSGLASTITRTAAGPDTVVLVWVDNANNPNNETSFSLQRATDAAFTTGLVTFTMGADVTTFTHALAHGADYYYRILASNLSGSSAWSNTLTVQTVPLTPTNFRTNGRSRTTIMLAWADVSSNETGYQLQRRRVGANTWTTVVTTAANVTAFTDTGRTRNTQYDYRIRGVNAVGNSPWAPTVRVRTLN